jgi:hypothetical protein
MRAIPFQLFSTPGLSRRTEVTLTIKGFELIGLPSDPLQLALSVQVTGPPLLVPSRLRCCNAAPSPEHTSTMLASFFARVTSTTTFDPAGTFIC